MLEIPVFLNMCFPTLGFSINIPYMQCIIIFKTVLWSFELIIAPQNVKIEHESGSLHLLNTYLIKSTHQPVSAPTTMCLLSVNSFFFFFKCTPLFLSPICSAGSGPIQLWQFLLELLTDKSCQSFISWTGDGWEFKLSDPDEVRGCDPAGHWYTCWEVLSS